MARTQQDARITQFVMGTGLIVLGGAFLLDAQGILEIGNIGLLWRYWPLFLIAMGVGHALDRSGSVFLAVMEILQGFVFLAITFNWRGLNWSHLAPLLLMTLGLAWIADALVRRKPDAETDSPEGDHR